MSGGSERTASFKRGIRTVYDEAAERYERHIAPTFAPIAERVIELARPSPDERHLDLATGSGLIPALLDRREPLTAPGLRIGLDLSGGMLRRARPDAPATRYVQADLEHLPVRPGNADVATLCLALHHLPDPRAALAEARRTLRRGGRLAAAAWGEEVSAPWLAFDRWFEAVGLGESRTSHQSGRPIATVAAFREALSEAGFGQARVESSRALLRFRDAATFWEWRTSFAATNRALARLPGPELARLRADCLSALAPYAGPDGVNADQAVLYALARA